MGNVIEHPWNTTVTGGLVTAVLDEPISENDENANEFSVTVKNANFESATCKGYFIRADGKTIILDGQVSGNTASVVLSTNCYKVKGRFTITVKVKKGESDTSWLRVKGYVEATSTDDYAFAGDDSAPLDLLLEAAEKVDEAVSEANEAAAAANEAAQAAENMLAAVEETLDSIRDDYTELAGDVVQLSEEINNINDYFFDVSSAPTELENIDGINVRKGWNAAPSADYITISANPGYDTYWFVPETDMDIWLGDALPAYAAICVGENFEKTYESGSSTFLLYCDNSVRYRTTDKNLPTEENKLHIAAGSAVAFSVTKNTTMAVYGFERGTQTISEGFAKEILSVVPKDKRVKLRYVTGSGEGTSTERLEIFVPSTVGYVRYDFVHSVNASINADNWRINKAYATDDNLAQRFALTAAGEWEAALHLADRSDFSGGISHGDEVGNSLHVFVDGSHVEYTEITETTECDEVRIVSTAIMFDPADSTTEICTHGAEHIFSVNGVAINQSVIWTTDCETTECYMAMFPSIKMDGDDKLYTDKDFAVETLPESTYRKTYKSAKTSCIHNENVGYFAQFSISDYPEGISGGDTFWVLDNGGLNYNKMYYVVTTGANVTAGDRWKSQSLYKLDVTK